MFWLAWEVRRERRLDDMLTQMRDGQTFDKLSATVLVMLAQS